uniref:ethanolamine kinase n=1 Tax=Lepeophtheirus salmonis TaxID=72036 RepID=A0A0K2V4Z9_LEPSM
MISHKENHIIDLKDIHVSSESLHSLKKGASSIVSKIRPLWDNHEYKIFNDGLTNKLIGVYPKGTSLSEMIIVRVYGEETDKLIDRKSELKFINILHSLDLSAPVYAIYGNGFAYGYSPGVTLNMDSVKDPNIYPLLAKKLSLFHKINLNPECTRQSKIWFKMREMVKFIRNSSHFHGLDKEVELCYEYFTGLNDKYKKIAQLNKVVLCHNDLLLGNIIYDESLKNVSLIDFEYLFDNYQWYDIANHFCEFVGLSTSLDFENCIPKEDFQKKWILHYMESMDMPLSNEDVHIAYLLVKKYMILSHLFWGIWSLVQTNISKIEFDFLTYGKLRLKEYYSSKANIYAEDF